MNQNDPPTEHILACLSSSPSNAKIVRTAATMAKAFGGTFTALYVRTPDSDQMGKEDCRRLQQHIRMAEQAGADISTIYGDDIPQQIAEFARISGITKIVLGRSSVHRRHFWSGPSLTEKLTLTAPNLDIYIIPDASAENGYGSGRKLFTRPLLPSVRDLLITAGILSCITLIGFFFLQLDFARYNIIMLYMLGVLFTAWFTSGYTCGVLGSVASVALYNFFMTEPYLTFHAYDPGYQVTFALMLTSAIITCALTTRLKDHAKMSAQAAFRTKILFDTNQLLQRAKSEEEILSQTASQLMKLLNRSLIVYPEQNGDLGSEQVFGIDGEVPCNIFSAPEERDAANWTFANKKRSGAGTDSYPDAKGLYLALRTGGGVFGVIGIDLSEKPLDAFENSVLLSILGEGALAIENRRNALEKEQAALQARNEELRANLLRTISHDLRTPLTSISGNASNLLSNGEMLDTETRNKTEILVQNRFLGLTGKRCKTSFLHRKNGMQQIGHLQTKSVPVQARIAARTQRGFILHFGPGAVCLEWLGSICPKNRWMPLKTVCCFPFWVKVRWPSKTAEMRWKKSKLHCRQGMKSCGQTCCARSPMICAPR